MPSKNFTGQVFEFTGIDSEQYFLSALTLEDWSKFVHWVQYKPYREANDAMLPKETLNDILKECQRGKVSEEVEKGVFEEYDISFSSTVVQDALAEQVSVYQLLLISLRKKHKHLTSISEVFAVNPEDNPELTITQAYSKLLNISGLTEAKTDEDEENPTSPNSTTT